MRFADSIQLWIYTALIILAVVSLTAGVMYSRMRGK